MRAKKRQTFDRNVFFYLLLGEEKSSQPSSFQVLSACQQSDITWFALQTSTKWLQIQRKKQENYVERFSMHIRCYELDFIWLGAQYFSSHKAANSARSYLDLVIRKMKQYFLFLPLGGRERSPFLLQFNIFADFLLPLRLVIAVSFL